VGKKAYALIACVIIVLAGGLYYFLKDEGVTPPPTQAAKSEQPAIMSYSGNSIIEEQDGKRLWELSAETIEINPQTKQVQLKNVKGVFYQTNGGKIEIVAAQAVYDTTSRDIVMNGQVKAISSNGAVFTAREAQWAGKDRRFYGTGDVTMTREDTVITGDRIESDGNMEKIKVLGNARVRKGGSAN